jgi:hypothetical protein
LDTIDTSSKRIAIVVIGTGIEFIFALRLITKFYYLYTGDCKIVFYLFSDRDAKRFTKPQINIKHNFFSDSDLTCHTQYKLIDAYKAKLKKYDYIYFINNSTDIVEPFGDEEFLGDLAAVNYQVLSSTDTVQNYFNNYFWGGSSNNVIKLSQSILESYNHHKDITHDYNNIDFFNTYCTTNHPTITIPFNNKHFSFLSKGGFQSTDTVDGDWLRILSFIRMYKGSIFTISQKEYTWVNMPKSCIRCEQN